MIPLDKTIDDLLNGASVDDAINSILGERVVCRYTGSPKPRHRKGKLYYVRSRLCTGKADPQVSLRASMAWKKGDTKQKAKISQSYRWSKFRPKAFRLRKLPGRKSP